MGVNSAKPLQHLHGKFVELRAEDLTHILDGDAFGGGHRHNAGQQKSEFPEIWTDAVIRGAARPIQEQIFATQSMLQAGSYTGMYNNVLIRIIFDRDPNTTKLFIATMYPLAGEGVTVWSDGRRKPKPLGRIDVES